MQNNATADSAEPSSVLAAPSGIRTESVFRSPWFDICQFIALLLFLCWLGSHSIENLGYHWQWYRIPDLVIQTGADGITSGPLLEGLWITVKISAVSMVFMLFFGMTTALFRLSSSPVARLIARAYLEVSRNTPLLIQLFFIYFVLGPVLGLDRFFSAVLALSLFEGAYASEIFRAGIISVDRGQREAAESLGLKKKYIYRFIILPQAFRIILPPLTSQTISLIKDSALVSTIAIYDLTMQAQMLIAETFLTFEIWFTVAILYLVITISLSCFVTFLEKRMKLV
ncbi:MAG: polar amino acid ABC transporter permease [Proteobacteria bacterium]|nr:MAG: polar amino acid ABC transporter permease [Pseudomonadota bacterium]